MPARVTGVDVPPVPELQVRAQPDRVVGKKNAREVRYLAGFGTGVSFGVHSDCLKNLVRGITERVLYVRRGEGLDKPPRPVAGVWDRLSGVRQRLLRKTRPTPVVDRDDYPELYSGRKRTIYQSAVDSLKTRGLTVRDSFVSVFIKAEKVNFTAKVDPAPRVIQPRSPRYNVEVGRYLKLFEKELVRGFARAFRYDVILKGMNADQVGQALAANWGSFQNPVAFGLDASRFDQHVSREALVWEHSVYNSVFRSKELARLLKWQLKNRGIGRSEGYRVDYTVDGCRMSGDINTGMGNCLIMSSIVLAYIEHHGLSARLSNNGDDCVVMCEAADLARFDGLGKWFLDFGFTLTREAPCYHLEEVEFCQFHPVRLSTGWRMVRNPLVAMSKDCVSLVGWSTDEEVRAWAHAVGTCGLALCAGVPVWEQWYKRLVELGRVGTQGLQERVNDCGAAYWARGCAGAEVDDIARHSFWRAFGILPDLQVALESEYALPATLSEVQPMMCHSQARIVDQQNELSQVTPIW